MARAPSFVTAAALFGLFHASAARADETRPKVVLEYSRAPGAESCPGTETMRAAVGQRLGYDPFADQAPRTVVVQVARRGDALHGRVEMRDASQHVTGSRDLDSAGGDCAELVASLALAVSVGIDPMSLSRSPSPAAPAPAPTAPAPAAAPTDAAAPTAPAEAKPEGSKARVRAGLGALVSAAAEPSVSAGVAAFVGLGWRVVSVDLEGRADLPASTDAPGGGRTEGALVLASLVPCLHRNWLMGCALVGGGALLGSGTGVAGTRKDTTFYAAGGVRLGAELSLSDAFVLRAYGDLLTPLTPTTLRLNGVDAWTTPRLSAALGIGIMTTF